jgi:hypothetical protein
VPEDFNYPKRNTEGIDHMDGVPNTQPAGGVATQRGISYQNRVVAALAAACLSEGPPGMDLPATPIQKIRCESGEPIGDVLVELTGGGFLFVEIKRSIRLSDPRFSELVAQLIKQFTTCEQSQGIDSKSWRRPLIADRDRLQIITSSESPEAVRKHLAACLDRIGSDSGPEELLVVSKSKAEGEAFQLFRSLVSANWKDLLGEHPSEEQVVRLFSFIKIGTADANENEADEAHTLRVIGTSILDDAEFALAAWSGLIDIAARAAQTRETLSRESLRSQFGRLGFSLKSSPKFSRDIHAIKEHTRLTLEAMAHLGEISVKNKPIRIERHVTKFLANAARQHSLLVIGEPGAGKSGVLHELGNILQDTSDVLFLAADRVDGPLRTQLGLANDLGEVLRNWTGKTPGFVIIDALDAARGSTASIALRDLMRKIAKEPESRWRVIASVRTYDLRYGQEIQQIFRIPFDERRPEGFRHPDFPFIRHILVPKFDPNELNKIFEQSPDLATVYFDASRSFQDLLANPFNLRLVADLLSSDLSHDEISAIETHLALLKKYWDHRVIKSSSEGTARELTLHSLLRVMVNERSLTVSKTKAIEAAVQPQFDPLCQDGVLVEQDADLHGRNIVGFSHHLLFDYAASRLYISTDRDLFLKELSEHRDLSLFLRLSIELLFKEAWTQKRELFWKILGEFATTPNVPSIARIIGPTVIPELAKASVDLAPLLEDINSEDPAKRSVIQQWIVHAVGAVLASGTVAEPLLWAHFTERLTNLASSPVLLAVAQSLVDHLIRQIEQFGDPRGTAEPLNRASVNLLDSLLQQSTRNTWLVGRVVTNLMDVIYAAPSSAIRALRQLITPDEIMQYGAEQGPWIARKISKALVVDPEFVADFYKAIFAYEETSEAQTSMSGSRILALNSNRGQDYRHIYWELSQFFPVWAEERPVLACGVVAAVINGYVERDHRVDDPPYYITFTLGKSAVQHQVKQDYSEIWDGATVRDDVQAIAGVFFRLLGEFAAKPESKEFAADLALLLLSTANYAVVPRRLLEIAVKHPEVFGPVVYGLVVSPSALLSYDLSTGIGDLLPKLFPFLSLEERSGVESAIHGLSDHGDPEYREAREATRDRLLGCIPRDLISVELTRQRVLSLHESEDGLPPNTHRYRSGGVYSVPYSPVDDQRRRGEPVDEPVNVALRNLAEPISSFAGRYVNSTPTLAEIEELHGPLNNLRQALNEADANGAHLETKNSSEATLVAGCGAAAKCKELDCSSSLGLLVKEVLLQGLSSPIPEHHPEYDAQFDKHPSWGAPLQRIEAAHGIGALLENEGCIDALLMDSVHAILRDPVPAVRFQIVRSLLALHTNHLDELWQILRDLARNERSISVLGASLYGVVNPLCGKYREDALDILRVILDRSDLRGDGGDAREWALRIAAGLYIWQGDESANGIIRPLISGESFDSLSAARCMRDIRSALTFNSDPPKPTDQEIRRRAFGLIETIVSSASTRIGVLLNAPEPGLRDEQWNKSFQDLAKLVDFAGNQIYFSSGAYVERGVSKPLSDSARTQFWFESKNAINRLSEAAIPSVAHHLIETLQSFIPIEPTEVFHAIAQVVRSAQGWGYQYESMAVELLVKITENYLAEYSQRIQEDLRAREELVDILEVFVDAGWPAARRLSYRLEEIFR